MTETISALLDKPSHALLRWHNWTELEIQLSIDDDTTPNQRTVLE